MMLTNGAYWVWVLMVALLLVWVVFVAGRG
jgi:hypothetical protein